MTTDREVTAGVLLIGDELLSGRTRDANLQAIAQFLQPLGVQVADARTVPDVHERIVAALNEMRARWDYVFTTGGIGPTHDDITADAVAAAFAVPIGEREDALAILVKRYADINDALTPARRRMARIPDGASLIYNSSSGAPGFQIGNVFVLAGVPGIMRAMLEDVGHRIEGGAVVASRTVRAGGVREGDIGEALAAAQAALDGVALGSYPYFRGPGDYGVHLVARSRDAHVLDAAEETLKAIVRAAGGEPEIGEAS
ncbi:MAG: molybdopterin-binding protein [Caulobacterales bacterium]|nr:molybdopterin-binding protein [Caulobacterales bacterium]